MDHLVVLVPGITRGRAGSDSLDELASLLGAREGVRAEVVHHGVNVWSGRPLWKHRRGSQLRDAAHRVGARIDVLWRSGDYKRMTLLGHSLGGILVRDAYLQGVESDGGPWAWPEHVKRLVLLAGMNKGWDPNRQRSLVPLLRAVQLGWDVAAAETLAGTAYILDLRLRWVEHCASGAKAPRVVNVLGSNDPLVFKSDMLDTEQFPTAGYVEITGADHHDLPKVADVANAAYRIERLRFAVFGDVPNRESPAELNRANTPWVLVRHGIRAGRTDQWVQTLNQLLDEAGLQVDDRSYGWFSALGFALPFARERYQRQFQEHYSEVRFKNPNAPIHFVGHSNGTYLIGRSLNDVESIKFCRVSLAGSVLPREFPWNEAKGRGQVSMVRNDCADRDIPVAILCSGLRGFRMTDVGTAGFDGFDGLSGDGFYQLVSHSGGHGQALKAHNLPNIAEFIADGDYLEPDRSSVSSGPARGLAMVSRLSRYLFPILVLAGVGAIIAVPWLVGLAAPWPPLINSVTIGGGYVALRAI